MTIKALYPTVRPTLNLNFARTKALDPRVTFTRASTATFVGSNGLIQTAASGAARFDHNPETGESLGLLVEGARTNLALRSEEFDNAAWGKTNVTITANTSVAPDGTTTADSMIEASGSQSTFRINQGVGVNGTYSLFAKEIPGSAKRYLYFGIGVSSNNRWAYAVVDLSTGSFVSKNDPYQHSITSVKVDSYPNGWKRVSAYCSSPLADKPFYIGLTNSANPTVTTSDIPYTGDGTSGIYIWGAQSESSASFPTSYIPTTTATVTRAADVASMTGTNFSSWYNQSEGTMFSDALMTSQSSADYWTITGGTGISNSLASYAIGLSNSMWCRSGGTNQVNAVVGTLAFQSRARIAYGIKVNNFASSLNGAAVVTDTSGAVPVSSTNINFGYTAAGYNIGGPQRQQWVRRLAFYPVRLPDAQLQALTS